MQFGLQHPNFSLDYNSQTSPSQIIDSLKELITKAENSGFDSFWVMDHFHQIQFVGKPEEPMLEGIHNCFAKSLASPLILVLFAGSNFCKKLMSIITFKIK